MLFPTLRPRQLEYHPTIGGRIVFGTTNARLCVANIYSGENGTLLAESESAGSQIILGISWLRLDPDKFLAGGVNGRIGVYSVEAMKAGAKPIVPFSPFPDLTSVNTNCTDQHVIVSGYSKHLNFYDIPTGKLLNVFRNMHDSNMNVVKFAHHSPFLFATSSTDCSIKLFDVRVPDLPHNHVFHQRTEHQCLMVCWSPDDRFLLSSAEDNEIKQWLSSDGRLHLDINHLPKRKNEENYSRSYYMNGGKYIITGSCDQSQIFVTSSSDGRLIREIELSDIAGHPANAKSVYCQSLRGDPIFNNRLALLSSYDSRDENGNNIFKLISVQLGVDELLGA